MDTSVLDRAMIFAIKAHASVERRGKGFPYIVHPMEAVAITATMTNDQELLAAAALHDILEDTDHTAEELEREFGKRIAHIVECESDEKFENMTKADSWHERKQIAMDRIKEQSREIKMVALGDKLSNMRAISRDYHEIGDELWNRFNITDRAEHAWRYRGLADALADLSDTEAYREFTALIDGVFGSRS